MADNQGNRPHRPNKEKKAHTGGKNPKAFAFNAPGKLKKAAARSTEVCETREYLPNEANRTRSKKSVSTSRSSTASLKKLPRSS
jgi:hypothetical protein